MNPRRSENHYLVGSLIFCLVSGFSVAYALDPVTGGNLSGEARARMDRERPDSSFETQDLPEAPDCRSAEAWAALPDKKDSADLAPPNTPYPEAQALAAADVFFIHPTTTAATKNVWNVPIDDPAALRDVDYILGFFASAFNAAAKVYAPRYREAHIYAFFDDKTDSGIKAIDLAHRDVERAFLYYLEHYNRGRPFILAGHSQGSIHGLRLLQEHILGKPPMNRMVGAYLIGGTVPENIQGIRPAQSASDTGVLIAWNAYTREGDPRIFTDGLIGWIDGAYAKMGNKPLLQINPLSWKFRGGRVPPSGNPGSLPVPQAPDETPPLVPGICGADASGDVLVIDLPSVSGFSTPAGENFPIFNTRYGDYHNFEYQLFYESIRENAVERVNAFSEASSSRFQ